ncbi:MAG: GNAT family N-acetyltransferase [Anaerolineales bacterium]|nr:GNAT family N-acetyltransferase [Anaerolineales bacterium]MCW5854507.1 GNAT family N-acetyltransferase [Anaerolineales bacterium]
MSAAPQPTPPHFRIVPAQEAHAAAIRQLVRAAGINPTGLAWERFLVALSAEDELIGCIQIKPHADGSRELASLAVAPAWQGRGLARALLEALLAGNHGELYLMCQSRLGPLYAKFGFQPVAAPDMPTYFRRVSKLAGVVLSLKKADEQLLVMWRPA